MVYGRDRLPSPKSRESKSQITGQSEGHYSLTTRHLEIGGASVHNLKWPSIFALPTMREMRVREQRDGYSEGTKKASAAQR